MALSTFTGPFGGFGDPFFDQLERSVDRAFNRSLMGPGLGRPSFFTDLMAVPTLGTTLGATAPTSADWWRSMGGTHPMDVVETDKEYEITADAPGFLPEDISVEVHDGNISIRGQRQETREEKDEGGRVWRSERAFRTFHRSFRLPDDAREDDVDANLEHGVLKVTVPKVEEAERPKPKRISVRKGEGVERQRIGGRKGGQAGGAGGRGAQQQGGEKPAPMATE